MIPSQEESRTESPLRTFSKMVVRKGGHSNLSTFGLIDIDKYHEIFIFRNVMFVGLS